MTNCYPVKIAKENVYHRRKITAQNEFDLLKHILEHLSMCDSSFRFLTRTKTDLSRDLLAKHAFLAKLAMV